MALTANNTQALRVVENGTGILAGGDGSFCLLLKFSGLLNVAIFLL